MSQMTRRALLAGFAALAASPATLAQSLSDMVVHKDPSCGCCGAWVAHVQAAGFRVRVIETTDLASIKRRFGVPDALESCHTAEIGGYVIEGHVPVAEIKRLLAERPSGRGLAVAGMPVNAPGMDVPGAADDAYEVMLFDAAGAARVFAAYRGAARV